MTAFGWETGSTDDPGVPNIGVGSRQAWHWAGGRSLALEDLDSCLFQGPVLASGPLSKERADYNLRGPFK